jgi:aspartyl-tRNA(Asn)/glutamyl-tRNA(Gln) amidotransferase subunit C
MINIKTIHKIAQLARLQVNENEAENHAAQLTKVLKHFEELSHVDTTNIEPLMTPTEIEFVLRSDEVHQEISTEELLKNAPEKMGQLLKVPPVL